MPVNNQTRSLARALQQARILNIDCTINDALRVLDTDEFQLGCYGDIILGGGIPGGLLVYGRHCWPPPPAG
jgi:hypothetical protein